MNASGAHYFLHVDLLVTGQAEEDHLPKLFSKLESSTRICRFAVKRRISQFSPRSEKRQLGMVGHRGHRIPDRAQSDISIPARMFLRNHPDRYLVLIDDLEHDRRGQAESIFELYRESLDLHLNASEKPRAAVHFLVNMLEAYFFADPVAMNRALGLDIEAHDGDVEDIRNPKRRLKQHFSNYRERHHGGQILEQLDLHKVLGNPGTCAWLRSCVSWIVRALRVGLDPSQHSALDETTTACYLEDGRCVSLTLEQDSVS